MRTIERRSAAAVAILAAAHASNSKFDVRAATAKSNTQVVPLNICGGAYCIEYEIDQIPLRAVVDTGSPFALVDGTCATTTSSFWGCYRLSGRDAGLADTEELFGGEDVGGKVKDRSPQLSPLYLSLKKSTQFLPT